MCSDNPSGTKIIDKTKCQEQASILGFSDTTATTIAMSGTVPGGCVFIQSKTNRTFQKGEVYAKVELVENY